MTSAGSQCPSGPGSVLLEMAMIELDEDSHLSQKKSVLLLAELAVIDLESKFKSQKETETSSFLTQKGPLHLLECLSWGARHPGSSTLKPWSSPWTAVFLLPLSTLIWTASCCGGF